MLITPLMAPPPAIAPSRQTPGASPAIDNPTARPLAAMLLAAIVAALLVAADALIDSHADGHLLFGWSVLWAVGFAAIALLADSARSAARGLLATTTTWRMGRADRQADAALWSLAQRDPRIMADLQGAMERAREARCQVELTHGRAWLDHRPVGTLNAAYTGPRHMFRSSPVTGLPMHQVCQPG